LRVGVEPCGNSRLPSGGSQRMPARAVILSAVFRPAKRGESKRRTSAFRAALHTISAQIHSGIASANLAGLWRRYRPECIGPSSGALRALFLRVTAGKGSEGTGGAAARASRPRPHLLGRLSGFYQFRQQGCPARQLGNYDGFVIGVGALSYSAQAIQRGDSKAGGEVSVRSPAD
jgi:hypothetical protein